MAVGERESQTGERVLGVGKAQGADYTVHILPGGGEGWNGVTGEAWGTLDGTGGGWCEGREGGSVLAVSA